MTETAAEYLGEAEPAGGKQSNITLSNQVKADYQILADYQGIQYSTLLRMVLETNWANPGVQALIRTAKSSKSGKASKA